jgi:hypothetical protein
LISSWLICSVKVLSAMPLPSCAHGNGLPYYSGYAAFLLLLFERVKTADTRHQCVPKKPQFQIRNAGRTDKRRVPDQFATGGRARWILAISNRARQAMLVWYAEGAGARTCRRHAKAGARDHRHRAIEQPPGTRAATSQSLSGGTPLAASSSHRRWRAWFTAAWTAPSDDAWSGLRITRDLPI